MHLKELKAKNPSALPLSRRGEVNLYVRRFTVVLAKRLPEDREICEKRSKTVEIHAFLSSHRAHEVIGAKTWRKHL